MKKKDMSVEEFRIFITAEMFVKEVQYTIEDGSLDITTVDQIFGSLELTWDPLSYKEEVLKVIDTILKEHYDFDMKYINNHCRLEKEKNQL